MRVTSRSLVDTVVRNLQQNARALDRLQNQISSGKRVTRPSEDPVAAWRSMRLRETQDGNTQHARNMEDARNWLVSSDRALTAASQALARLRELAVQGADDSYRPADRAALAREVAQVREHLLSVFNGTQFVGQYVFSGRKTATPPFSEDAQGNVVYNGETGITVPVASSDLVPSNGIEALTLTGASSAVPGTYRLAVAALVPGETAVDVTITRYDESGVAVPGATQTVSVTIPAAGDLEVVDFGDIGLTLTANASLGTLGFAETATSEFVAGDATITREIGPGVQLPVNMLATAFLTTFQDITRLHKALVASDQASISKGIAHMDRAIEMTLVAQAELGTRTNRLDVTLDRAFQLDADVAKLRSDVETLDMAEALTRLTTQQAIFRASLETGARTIPMSILDFLR